MRAGEGLELGRVDEDDGDCELLEEGENRDSVVEASEADAELGEVSELEIFIGGCGVGAGDVVCVSRNLLASSAVGAVWTGRARIGPAKSRSKFAGRIIVMVVSGSLVRSAGAAIDVLSFNAAFVFPRGFEVSRFLTACLFQHGRIRCLSRAWHIT